MRYKSPSKYIWFISQAVNTPTCFGLIRPSSEGVHVVTRYLKAGIVEREETSISRQQLGKHASMAMNTHATTEELLEAVSSTQSVPRLYNEVTEQVSQFYDHNK
jgi:hypothetical protein